MTPQEARQVVARTRCEACHRTESWASMKFNHAKTGFPLEGRHAQVGCRQCHVQDLKQPLPRACAGCHPDVHGGSLGQRCEGCHDSDTWRTTFNVDAHRATNFPLVGGHAAVPCVECHPDIRDRRFDRPAVPCVACHAQDRLRTVGTAIDHDRLGFSERCQECHLAFSFRPARFPAHDRCFPISAGPHAVVQCAQCHVGGLLSATSTGSCDTRTATCTGCHAHRCTGAGGTTRTDIQHAEVPGYRCIDRKCFECHQATP